MKSIMGYSSAVLFVILCIFGQVNARESKFFSKTTRHISKANNNNLQVSQISLSEAPSLAPALSPQSEFEFESDSESSDQFGLYGDEARYETRYDNDNDNNNNNNYFYGKNDEQLKPEGMSDTRFLENGKYYHDIKDDNTYFNENNFQNNHYDSPQTETERYVFDSMEEYEKYQESRHAYLP